MGFISQKVFQARALCTHILIFVFFASLLVACGDDSVSRPNEDSKDNPELSSKREDSKSSSSTRSHRRSSSSSVKGKVSSSSSIKIELPPEDGLDIVYVFEDGTVSGADPQNKNVKVRVIVPGQEDIVVDRHADTFEAAVTECAGTLKDLLVQAKEKRFNN